MLTEENSATGLGIRHETPAPPAALSEHQLTEANQRWLWLKAAEPLLAAGLSQSAVAAAIGITGPTFSRLLNLAPVAQGEQLGVLNAAEKCRRLIAAGREALAPDVADGRVSEFAALLAVPDIANELNRLYAASMGASCAQATIGRRTGSLALALKRLGDFPLVPARLASKLQAGGKPKPLIEFLKRNWTPEIEAKLRGQKHYGTATVAGRRALEEELADGSRVPLQPGRVWVMDDMSSNIPFWFEVDASAAGQGLGAMINRHGCAVGRQGLYAWDWASSAWLGLDLIGRLRDAYQSSDILRFLRKLMTRYGKPDKLVIEQGVWKSRNISGWTLSKDEETLIEVDGGWTIDEMAGDETARITDGIRALGVEIIYAYTPRGKPIEGAFNYLQRIVPTCLQPGEAVNIGRHAGEFEWAARQARRAAAGVAHARDLGFIHIDRLADVSWQAMLWDGTHVKDRRDGKPLELLAQHLANFPLPPLTQRDLAVFLPEQRSRIYKGGTLLAEVAGELHEFLNPEIFPQLPAGTKLDFAFDPSEPTLGAAIYGEKGFLCWADYLAAGPVISARDRSEDAGPQLLKRYKLAHRTAARLLDLTTLRTVKIAESRSRETTGGGASVPASRLVSSLAPPAPPTRVRPRLTAAIGESEENFNRQADRLAREEARAQSRARQVQPLVLDD